MVLTCGIRKFKMDFDKIVALESGAIVKLHAHGGKIIERRVVRVHQLKKHGKVYDVRPEIVNEEEWLKRGKKSRGICWPADDVVAEV